MDRYLSTLLFSADTGKPEGASAWPAYDLSSADDLGLKEAWLQNAIANEPELVIAPCRAAELIDEDERWFCWSREVPIKDVGSIDLLLVSQLGRVAIVETKMSYHPGGRRTVLAQLLDYAVHLPTVDAADLPALPNDATRSHGLSLEQVSERIKLGDFLIIVAGDQLDSRAVMLGRSLLGDHLVNEWSLALVEVAIFSKMDGSDGAQHLLVPHLRGVVVPEKRQVVKVFVDGPKTRVTVERVPPISISGSRENWSADRFFRELAAAVPPGSPAYLAADRLYRFATEEASVYWGTGAKTGVFLSRWRRPNGMACPVFGVDTTGCVGICYGNLLDKLPKEAYARVLDRLQQLDWMTNLRERIDQGVRGFGMQLAAMYPLSKVLADLDAVDGFLRAVRECRKDIEESV